MDGNIPKLLFIDFQVTGRRRKIKLMHSRLQCMYVDANHGSSCWKVAGQPVGYTYRTLNIRHNTVAGQRPDPTGNAENPVKENLIMDAFRTTIDGWS